MRGYFEAQKKHLLEQVSDNNPEVEQRLKEAFGKALDEATRRDGRILGVLSTKGSL